MGKKVGVSAWTADVVTLETRIHILLEEYRMLYSLLTFRLAAMERRLPAIGGLLVAVLGSTPAMPKESQLLLLAALPITLAWLFLATVQHALSKEDHVRRIDEIERLVNLLAGQELLVFQSRHPNTARFAGGRTGQASVLSTLIVCLTLLLACLHSMRALRTLANANAVYLYELYLSGLALIMLIAAIRLGRYRYQRPPPRAAPILEVREHSPPVATQLTSKTIT